MMAKNPAVTESKPKGSEATDMLAAGLKEFAKCEEAESDNRATYVEDTRFALSEEQWPVELLEIRKGRPCPVVNKLRVFGNQVVNSARQNKPGTKVHPADSSSDVETAKIFNGLIRQIEAASSADVAYDTAIACAVFGGFGYWRFGLDYATDDTFDLDITLKRVENPLTVYGDPNNTDADSANWNTAFVCDWLSNQQFEDEYGDKVKADWKQDAGWKDASAWRGDQGVMVGEWWSRKAVQKPIVQLLDVESGEKQVADQAQLEMPEIKALISTERVKVLGQRMAKSYETTQRIMSGVEILSTRTWPGKYIPIVPVYGDEFNIEGTRYLRSLVHGSLDSQRLFNYWRAVAAEVAGYSPRVPYIGAIGQFATDKNWETSNSASHPYLEYDPISESGAALPPPQRQPMDMGVAAGALQEALNASDDIKATIGMFDASIGARSNETSGRAINARRAEGDTATFQFPDNLNRAIRHSGRIMIDLIQKVYTTERIIRVLGEDGKHSAVPLKQPTPVLDPKTGQPQPETDDQGQPVIDPATGQAQIMMRVYDLGVGKYDLTVEAGPNYTTRREEASAEMSELLRSYPAAAPVILPRLAKNSDWPEADEIANDLEKLSPVNGPQVPPEVQQQMDQTTQQLQQLQAENEQLKQDQSAEQAKLAAQTQAKKDELAANEQIKREELASNERIELEKVSSQERIANYKAAVQARATLAAVQQQSAQPPKGPSESIAFKDLPPEGQAQMAAQAGIHLSPQQMADYTAAQDAKQAAASAQKTAMQQVPQQQPTTKGRPA